MRTCDVEGCDRKHKARGLCVAHYNRVIEGRPVGGLIHSQDPDQRMTPADIQRVSDLADAACPRFILILHPNFKLTRGIPPGSGGSRQAWTEASMTTWAARCVLCGNLVCEGRSDEEARTWLDLHLTVVHGIEVES